MGQSHAQARRRALECHHVRAGREVGRYLRSAQSSIVDAEFVHGAIQKGVARVQGSSHEIVDIVHRGQQLGERRRSHQDAVGIDGAELLLNRIQDRHDMGWAQAVQGRSAVIDELFSGAIIDRQSNRAAAGVRAQENIRFAGAAAGVIAEVKDAGPNSADIQVDPGFHCEGRIAVDQVARQLEVAATTDARIVQDRQGASTDRRLTPQ